MSDTPVDKAAPRVDDFAELGSTGLRQYGGVLAEEYVPHLRGRRGIQTITEMLNDPIVGGSLSAIDQLLRQVGWTWEPRDDSAEARRWADFCASCAGDMSSSWSDTLSAIYSFLPYGWSYVNTVLKRRNGEQPETLDAPAGSDYDDGLVGWRRISLRPQDSLDRWEFDEATGALAGMWQAQQAKPAILIPIQSAGLFRAQSWKDSPEGRSVLRSAYTPWWEKRKIRELEVIGLERDLAGIPIAWVPPEILSSNASPEQQQMAQAFREIVTGVRRNAQEGLLWPLDYDEHNNKRYDFALLSSSSSRHTVDVKDAVAARNVEITISVLTDWLLIGHEANGSRSVASSKVDVFTAALDSAARSVADVFNAHLTPRLLAANGVPRRLAPRLSPANVEKVDLAEFASSVAQLLTAGGLTPDEALEDRIRATMGLPPRADAAAA